MRKTAWLVAACLALTGAAAARAQETAPMPKETAPGAAPAMENRSAEPAGVEGAAYVEPPPCGLKHAVGHLWGWLTFRKHRCRSCDCCRLGCSCDCCEPLYTFFPCVCYPTAHLPFPPYIGQNLPPRDHCCP
jgi:hypothetical protein